MASLSPTPNKQHSPRHQEAHLHKSLPVPPAGVQTVDGAPETGHHGYLLALPVCQALLTAGALEVVHGAPTVAGAVGQVGSVLVDEDHGAQKPAGLIVMHGQHGLVAGAPSRAGQAHGQAAAPQLPHHCPRRSQRHSPLVAPHKF